jgi:signal transduction histidine kinase
MAHAPRAPVNLHSLGKEANMRKELVLESTPGDKVKKECLDFPLATNRNNRNTTVTAAKALPAVRGELLRFEAPRSGELARLSRELVSGGQRLGDYNARSVGRFSRLAIEAVRERGQQRHLQHKLRQTQLKLAAAELRAAEAEARLNSHGEFECSVAILAHDIASPLTGLVGFLQLVIDMVDDDYSKEEYSVLLKDAEEAAWRMRRLLVRMQSITEPQYKKNRESLGELELAELRKQLHS